MIHGLRREDVADPQLTFLVARIDGHAAGCGALRPLEPGVGEVKRMFVRPAFRGRGVARQVLAALEAAARARGYSMLRLETATRQPEAIGLYRSAGYVEIPCFGADAGNRFSVCFEKRLA
jgi:putative acetyltransferase